jgi:hypothetical protein
LLFFLFALGAASVPFVHIFLSTCGCCKFQYYVKSLNQQD